MDYQLFQFNRSEGLYSAGSFGKPDVRATAWSAQAPGIQRPSEKMATSSRNLDLLRSFAVMLVVGFHLAKFSNWHFGKLRVTDFGLLGVMFFFVHTTLVLMFSLERQRAGSSAALFVPFMVRRCFRIYPLAILVVTLAFLFHIPSDLQFGKFNLLHQSAGNFLANLLLVQNVTLQKPNPGILWSLPLELQMYTVLPALFLFAARVKSSWGMIAFWWSVVALWFGAGFATGVLPLHEGGARAPAEAMLKFTRFVPCFLPGIVAYKLWSRPRLFAASFWPVFLALCCAAFMWLSGSQPIETGWFICFTIGLGVCFFREMRENLLTRLTKRIARYSYGIYLVHYFAIWIGFAVCRSLNVVLQITIFAALLVSLSVLLYHGVEAPMIAAGVKISGKLKHPIDALGVRANLAERTARIFSE